MAEGILTVSGGAKIGWIGASWPLATLAVTRDSLNLNVRLLGKYAFTPDQVTSIENHTVFPIFGRGIKINHNVSSYPKNIVFNSFGNPDDLIAKITETGFIPRGSIGSIDAERGIPVRWQAIAAIFVLWDILLMADGMQFIPLKSTQIKPGLFSLLAVALLFVGSVSFGRVKFLQDLIMKPGRSPSEIKPWLNLIGLVSGIFTVVLLIVFIERGA